MASLYRCLALASALALVASACGDNGPADGAGPVQNLPDAGVEVGFGPGADLGANADTGSGTEDTAALPGEPVGAACNDSDDCQTGSCLDDDRFPDGICSLDACGDNSDCGADGICVVEGDSSYCAAGCQARTECRDGYDCLTASADGDHACVPSRLEDLAVDGEACAADTDCRGGTCITNSDWIDGYCTTLDCETFEDCSTDGQNNRCLIQRRSTNFCVRICDETADCREGYICEALTEDQGYCSPNPFQAPVIDVESYPFDILCQDTEGSDVISFDYTIADDTVAYMVMPFAADGRTLVPFDIERPVGNPINLRGANDFQLAGTQIFGFLNPTVVPATPEFVEQLEPGLHTYSIETDSSRICHYLLEENVLGTTLDINMYLVGVPGISADTAAGDPDITAMLAQVQTIYAQAGITLGEVRFLDVSDEAATEYAILRNEDDLDNLVALSQIPGEGTRDDVLSANVFFVRALADGTGAIGISMGLPGPAALHGTGASGVVFTAEFLGQVFDDRFNGDEVDGDNYTGVVFAHEVGHYLGLFHTSEQFGYGYDPLDDTPQCGNDFPDGCEDLTNFMFPLAGIDHTVISEAQTWVMAVNPLTKE